MKRFFLSVLLALTVTAAPAAELKMGVVDMAKAFTEFYRTKEANAALQMMADKFKEELMEREAEGRVLVERAAKLREGDKARGEMLQKRVKERKILEQQLEVLERETREYQQRTKAELEQEITKRRGAIYEEIGKIVEEQARAAPFDLVLDKSHGATSSAPLFLYLREGALHDITAEVIWQLNKNAPAGVPITLPPLMLPAPVVRPVSEASREILSGLPR